MTWILSEAGAFKDKFTGITVSDSSAASTRPVEVKYRLPQEELSDTSYPMIALEIEGVEPDHSREHRGVIPIGYLPESLYDPNVPTMTKNPDTGEIVVWDPNTMPDSWSPIFSGYPIPYQIRFSVTVYARLRTHLYEIVGQLLQTDRIPDRYGFLEVPDRGTTQSLFLLSGPTFNGSKDANDKTLHTAFYEVAVLTEFSEYDFMQITSEWVSTVNLTISSLDTSV